MEIDAEDLLYRRLAPHQVNRDSSVNSSAFKRSGSYETQISVDVARLSEPQVSVDRAGRPGFTLGAVLVRDVRALGFTVEHDPRPDNPAHALVKGWNDQATSRALASATRVLPGIVS